MVVATADVAISDTRTTSKYPEYDRVWEDDVLEVVAVFGKHEDGARRRCPGHHLHGNPRQRTIRADRRPPGRQRAHRRSRVRCPLRGTLGRCRSHRLQRSRRPGRQHAYVDSALNDAHAAVNPDDPAGTKYVDIVTNALPAFFHSTADATRALIHGLMSYDDPRTYEMMFADIDSYQVVLVSGEHDNTYVPGAVGFVVRLSPLSVRLPGDLHR